MYRTTLRQARTIGRRFQSTNPNLDKPAFVADPAKKKVSLFLAAPIIAATAINTYFVEAEHAHHREHNKHLSDEEWPVKPYPYLNVRRVDFFWGDGDKTLFWNSDCNRHIK